MEESVKDPVAPEEQKKLSASNHSQEQPFSSSTGQKPIANSDGQISASQGSTHSYQAYSWGLLNRVLDIVDKKTNGRAGLLQRMVSYLFFGGLAALTNLLILYLMFYHVLASLSQHFFIRNTLSYIVAAEISILANFIPNDHFTFHALPGAKRPWIQRCLRFHLTAIVGSILTYLIELGLSTFTPLETVRAEALATIIVLIYNFSFHHIFTYRGIKGDTPESSAS